MAFSYYKVPFSARTPHGAVESIFYAVQTIVEDETGKSLGGREEGKGSEVTLNQCY
ncbi:MAG: hypothetical protein M3258_02295 [Thermoproteota archaeon]|jgi:hypothetical protein|nr:hypothetical protein [Thermoproteota archaeon]